MCLAIPAQITQRLEHDNVLVNIGGIAKVVSVAFVEDAAVGDFVIIHAGFALTKLDEQDAQKTLSLFAAMLGERT